MDCKVVSEPLKPRAHWVDVWGENNVVRVWRNWAEEHWEAVGMAASIAGALVFSVVLAVAFNVISTRIDDLWHEVVNVKTPVNQTQSRTSAPSRSGAF
jgi:hypothetical protein